MVKIINNLWSMIKMVIILIFMLVGVHFVGTEKLVETGLICLGFYFSYKLIELLSVYLKNKINGVKMDKTVKASPKPLLLPCVIYSFRSIEL